MSVSRRGRFAARWAAGLGVLAAFPFLASGVSQAAMAGANPMQTNNKPDLRTVHVNSSSDTAEFCFDKTVANNGPRGPGDFFLGGYRFDEFAVAAAANTEAGNANCMVADMSPKPGTSTVRDLNSYSYGSVNDGTVINNSGGGAASANIGDSTANLDSVSHNGTAGHTQGPDLASVSVDLTHNRLNYVFDQAVHGSSAADGKFLYYDANGKPHWGFIFGTSGNIVSVQFGAPGPFTSDTVSQAISAVVIRGSAFSEGQPQFSDTTDNGAVQELQGDVHFDNGTQGSNAPGAEVTAPTESVSVPGTSGLTGRPVLQSAALVPGPTNQIDYTFSLPISAGDASDLFAVTSDGAEERATAETIISSNTVRATFSEARLQNFAERIVEVSAYGCASGSAGCGTTTGAVQSVNPSSGAVTRFNQTGGVPVGDNAGAFATGYTTGPDARSVTFNNSNGTVTVQMDQRVDPNSLCNFSSASCGNGFFELLDGTGTVIDPSPLSASVINNSPFQSQIALTYPPGDVQRSTQLLISGYPVDTTATGAPGLAKAACSYFGNTADFEQCAVRQVISPSAGASSFIDPAKGRVHYRWHYTSKRKLNRALTALKRHHRVHHAHRSHR